MFSPTSVILWLIAIGLGVMAYRHPDKKKFGEGMWFAWEVSLATLPRVAMALLSAGFLSEILPKALVAQWLGDESGFLGILIASVVGGLIPGGPIISFPVAVVLYKAGVDWPQLVAMLTAWSVFALHRVISYEIPLMGARFSAVRLTSSLVLPPLAGVMAAFLLALVQGKPLTL